MADLLAALRKASALLGGSPSAARALPTSLLLPRASELSDAVDELQLAADAHADAPISSPAEVSEALVHLSRQLTSLEPQLRQLVLQPPRSGTGSIAVDDLFYTAFSAVGLCAEVALQLSRQGEHGAARHVLTCAALLLGAGWLAMRAPQGSPCAQPGPSQQEGGFVQLLAAAKLVDLVCAVRQLLGFGSCAKQTFPAKETLRWLGVLTSLFTRGLDPGALTDSAFVSTDVMDEFCSMCQRLLAGLADEDGQAGGPAFAHLKAAIERDTGLQRSMVRLLWEGAASAAVFVLHQQAARGPAAWEGGSSAEWVESIFRCYQVADTPCFAVGRRLLVRREPALVDRLGAAALAALPPAQRLDVGGVQRLSSLFLLVGGPLCDAMQTRLGAAQPASRSSPAPPSRRQEEVASMLWPVLPRLLGVRQAVAEHGLEGLQELGELAELLLARAAVVGPIHEPDDLQQLLKAATAALRLSAASKPAEAQAQSAASGLSNASLCALQLWSQCRAASSTFLARLSTSEAARAAAWAAGLPAMASAARRLHITGCRAAHQLASSGREADELEVLLPYVADSLGMMTVMQGLPLRTADTQQLKEAAQRFSTAACAAAAEVYARRAEAGGVSACLAARPDRALDHVQLLSAVLASTLAEPGCLLTSRPELLEHLLAVMPFALTAAEQNATKAGSLALKVAQCLKARQPDIGRALVSRGFVRRLLEVLTAHLDRMSAPAAQLSPMAIVSTVLEALRSCLVSWAPLRGGSLLSAQPAAQPVTRWRGPDSQKFNALGDLAVTKGLVAQLEEACRFAAQFGPFNTPEADAQAAAVQAADEEAAHLQLAQAAATRCCAYLRCSNVAAVGGPDAGEGEGAKLCSACRVCWYCSPACQRLDWKEGGHKRMCGPLAEAKQQDRERRRSEAAEGQAVEP